MRQYRCYHSHHDNQKSTIYYVITIHSKHFFFTKLSFKTYFYFHFSLISLLYPIQSLSYSITFLNQHLSQNLYTNPPCINLLPSFKHSLQVLQWHMLRSCPRGWILLILGVRMGQGHPDIPPRGITSLASLRFPLSEVFGMWLC